MDTMLAAVYHGPHDIRLEEMLVPQPGPGEAVMRVRAASICATDLRIFNYGHFKIPEGAVRILGHELAGASAAAYVGNVYRETTTFALITMPLGSPSTGVSRSTC
jgi:threonine dehydrogenase-like Zn-dependent dehydrogenase